MKLNKKNYSLWTINGHNYPYKGDIEQKIKFISQYGRLAPSVHNTQPWLLSIEKNVLTICPNFKLRLPVADPLGRGMFIAIGACAENIAQAAPCFGMNADVALVSDGVKITFEEGSPLTSNGLSLESITSRHSNKGLYTRKLVPRAVIAELEGLSIGTVEVKVLTEEALLNKISNLHINAAREVVASKSFVRELARWMRINNTRADDGMPGFITGITFMKSFIGKIIFYIRPSLFKKAVENDVKLLRSTPSIVVFSNSGNSKKEWMECGRIIERVWLKLTAEGLVAHPLTASIGDEVATKKLRDELKLKKYPQFLMRMGYSMNIDIRTPRRMG